ncbi:MAG: alpha/beta fold hydrolase [Armatimonadetes bacterium]|nr:alpha/beta fold hydrolase [Anaerolineae bacterium]
MMPPITAFNGDQHKAFTLTGGKPAALLVHGFPGTPDEMRPTAEVLHAAGWTTHALLLPGFGADINTLRERTTDQWLTAVIEALTALKRQHTSVMLVGHSMGAALAIKAAAQTPVDGLIVFAPFYKLTHVLWSLLPALKIVLPNVKPFRLMKPDFNDPKTREGILNFMPGADLDNPAVQAAVKDFAIPMQMIDQIRLTGQRAYQAAPTVKCPALVLQGRQDTLVLPAITQQLMGRMGGAVQYTEVDGEHDIIASEKPAWDEITQAVLTFAALVAPQAQHHED